MKNQTHTPDDTTFREDGLGNFSTSYESANDTYQVYVPQTESLTTTIVLAVAAVTDVEPVDLPNLTESIDPDALDALLSDGTDSVTVSFTYADCEITVDSGRSLSIRQRNR